MNAHDVLINPFRMLRIQYENPLGLVELAVVECRYVPVPMPHGPARTAIQIVFDNAWPMPNEPYYCPRARLVRQLIAPARVRSIGPWMSYPPSEHLGFVTGPDGQLYSQHFHGENEGAAVITGPTPMGGAVMEHVPEHYRVEAVSADDARTKLAAWRQTEGWPL